MAPNRDCAYLLTLVVFALALMYWSVNMTADYDDGSASGELEDYDDADDRLLRRMPSPLPTPSPSPITGPMVMKSIVGECFQFSGRDGNGDENRYEFCGFKSVRQTVTKNGNSYSCGYWTRWNTEQSDGKTKWVSQFYDDGESCGGDVRRTTTIFFQCREDSEIPEILSAREPSMCQYELQIAIKEWCEVEKSGLAGKNTGLAAPGKA
jgi:hypothetical protein